jgi:hypothetical protein
VIDAYLADLDRALALPRRTRRRILAEARDHLECAVAAARADGLDPRAAAARAVAAFGPPALVATRFAEELAAEGARRATRAAVVAVAAYGAFFAASTQIRSVRAASPFAGDPAGAIAWFAAQVAATCAALGALRAWRHRRDAAVPAGKLRYLNRGAAVAVGAVLAGVLADAIAAASAPSGGGATRTVLLAALAVVGAVALGALAETARAGRRTRAFARLDDRPAGDDVFDDLAALVPPAAVVLAVLRAHPWRLCALAGAAAGFVLTVTHLVAEGPPSQPALALAVAAIFVGAESVAILASFAVLGRFLGLRR